MLIRKLNMIRCLVFRAKRRNQINEMQNLFWGFLNFLGTFWNVVSRQVRETDQSAVSFLLILAGC